MGPSWCARSRFCGTPASATRVCSRRSPASSAFWPPSPLSPLRGERGRVRGVVYALLRRALFQLDAEAAHEFTARQMEHLQQIPVVLRAIERYCCPPASAARTFLGMRFRSSIGIAGGFDKNATMMPFLAALGFGFIEV